MLCFEACCFRREELFDERRQRGRSSSLRVQRRPPSSFQPLVESGRNVVRPSPIVAPRMTPSSPVALRTLRRRRKWCTAVVLRLNAGAVL